MNAQPTTNECELDEGKILDRNLLVSSRNTPTLLDLNFDPRSPATLGVECGASYPNVTRRQDRLISATFCQGVRPLPVKATQPPLLSHVLPLSASGEAVRLRRAKPFLRWAGSKRKQLARLSAFWSEDHTRYVEPFAGSACLFFELAPADAVLGDSNRELIEVYRVVQDEPERLYRRLCRIRRDPDTYKRWRAQVPSSLDRETRALRFLYLNRNCFNGIYRTNVAGQFNVPMGRRPGAYFAKEDFLRCSELLNNATLVTGDFTKTLEHVKAGDFVYLDPPYAVNSRRIFRQYGKRLFDTTDIPRFAKSLDRITQVGADFLVSYADCTEARTLARQWNSVRLPVRRHIAGFAGARKNAYEWLITNLPINRNSEVSSVASN